MALVNVGGFHFSLRTLVLDFLGACVLAAAFGAIYVLLVAVAGR